ncbi:MAG: hypothetical protein WEE64_00935 [Dehalococcoidia bacterium]
MAGGGSLGLVREKLDWAGHHLNALEHEIQAFKDTDPIPVGREFDLKTTEEVWYVDGVSQEPPRRLSFIAGDFLSNLRASLDYLVWQLVLENGGTPERSNAFPICAKPSAWASALSRDRLKGTSDKAVTAIKGLQPCFGTNPYRNQWLQWIDDLAVIDKHRHLHLFTAGTEGGFFLPGVPMDSVFEIRNGRVENGTELARLGGHHPGVNFAPAIGIAFRAGGAASDESVRMTFYAIREMVKIILEEFSELFS